MLLKEQLGIAGEVSEVLLMILCTMKPLAAGKIL